MCLWIYVYRSMKLVDSSILFSKYYAQMDTEDMFHPRKQVPNVKDSADVEPADFAEECREHRYFSPPTDCRESDIAEATFKMYVLDSRTTYLPTFILPWHRTSASQPASQLHRPSIFISRYLLLHSMNPTKSMLLSFIGDHGLDVCMDRSDIWAFDDGGWIIYLCLRLYDYDYVSMYICVCRFGLAVAYYWAELEACMYLTNAGTETLCALVMTDNRDEKISVLGRKCRSWRHQQH